MLEQLGYEAEHKDEQYRMDMGGRWNTEADFLGAKQNVMVGIDVIKTYPVHRLCRLAEPSSDILASSCR